MSLEVVNPNAGGIDVGSKSHWVAIGQDAQDIREFGVYSQDNQELCKWLSENGIKIHCHGEYRHLLAKPV